MTKSDSQHVNKPVSDKATSKTPNPRHATSPKIAAGKRQTVLNGKRRKSVPYSVRELRADSVGMHKIVAAARKIRTEYLGDFFRSLRGE